ncbi:MAG TPA: glycosyltransferase family 2 protein [Acidimicrobiales bacterium]|nr:glycosyltransferase family 2 protein [Acidimicrobiales bacterium]
MARVGGVAAVASLLTYLVWRVAWTLPLGGWNRSVAWTLVAFEALPLTGLIIKAITLWSVDTEAPQPCTEAPLGMRVVVLIPTFNEPVEVIAPTVAAACALQPAHETWVLDDGDRYWVAEMCESFGARYVNRSVHDHAKAGNLNHALDVLRAEDERGVGGADIIAVLDCDHVPLPTFLTATLGWFADDDIALVQGPQSFYNAGAFDDDGVSGEQGLFFNVLMPARQHSGAGPFWCGSTSLLRVKALQQVGGVATETITEDMHTTLKLIRLGWKTAYHHQTLAVGLAPSTPGQYLLQRRRWGMGAMQILVRERLWAAKRWMSWRNFHEYLNGTLWWLEGLATLVAFIVPITVMLSGAETSTAAPLTFTVAFLAMFVTRLWGSKRLMRGEIQWPTAFALRIFRVPVGLACLWWLVARKTLTFEVTPKGGADQRHRGRAPRVLWVLMAGVGSVLAYASAGLAGWVPWRTSAASTFASGAWLALAGIVLVSGTLRIRAAEYATSRRNAHRIPLRTKVTVDDREGELVDISVGGAAVTFQPGVLPSHGLVQFQLPGAAPLKMEMVTMRQRATDHELASLKLADDDWNGYRTMSLWLFHTPPDLPALPPGFPAIATTRRA